MRLLPGALCFIRLPIKGFFLFGTLFYNAFSVTILLASMIGLQVNDDDE
jgi:hypothetical protein